MRAAGDHVPHVTVWAGTREPVTIQKLVEEGPILLFFYLFDWSST
jgi:peroxiredoxin